MLEYVSHICKVFYQQTLVYRIHKCTNITGLQWLVKSFQRLLKAEASKTLDALTSLADKQAKRMEEMHSILRDMKEQLETFTKNTFLNSSSIARPDQVSS